MLCTRQQPRVSRMQARSSRPVVLTVRCQSSASSHSIKQVDGGRRSVLLAGALAAAMMAAPAASQARDYKDALAKKEARKAQLREAAGQIKSSGKDQQVFKQGEYSLPEEAHTPNMHKRQNEGARTQDNV